MDKNSLFIPVDKTVFSAMQAYQKTCLYERKKSLEGAKNATFGRMCRFDLDGEKVTLRMGENCEFGDFTHIVALKIGNNVLVASKCFISDCSHGTYSGKNVDSPLSKPNERALAYGTVEIGDNVWIGENAVILMGSRKGDGCIIGANATISRAIPANSMVIERNHIIKRYNQATSRKELME